MRQFLDDKRVRTLAIALLVVLLVLGLLNIISTAFSLLVPLAAAAAIAFAFYKLAIEGRDANDAKDVMEDEIAASAGAAGDRGKDAEMNHEREGNDEEDEAAARKRLSAMERAQSAYFDSASPAEEILDQIKSRKQRLAGDDDA